MSFTSDLQDFIDGMDPPAAREGQTLDQAVAADAFGVLQANQLEGWQEPPPSAADVEAALRAKIPTPA